MAFCRLFSAILVLYICYVFAIGGHHPDMRIYDIDYIGKNCPYVANKVEPFAVRQHISGDWSPSYTEYFFEQKPG